LASCWRVCAGKSGTSKSIWQMADGARMRDRVLAGVLAHGQRIFLPSLAGLLHLFDAIPSHEWLGYCHPVALQVHRLHVLRTPKNRTSPAPFVQPKRPLVHGWNLAGERARVWECGDVSPLFPTATCRRVPRRGHARALQIPSAVRRGIFVEIGIIKSSSSVGAGIADGHHDVAPTELHLFAWLVLQRFQSYGLRRLLALSASKISTALLVITGRRAGISDGGGHVFVSLLDCFGSKNI